MLLVPKHTRGSVSRMCGMGAGGGCMWPTEIETSSSRLLPSTTAWCCPNQDYMLYTARMRIGKTLAGNPIQNPHETKKL